MELLDRVRRTISRHGLAGPGTRVLAAVSGGSDSVALATLLLSLHDAGELAFAGVAHFNHQLRPGADADEQFCAGLAARLGVPFVAGRGDVAARARDERRSLEDAARAARHEFLDHARGHCGADLVATGHTRDDQAETFLLRLVRGAGVRGLGSMHPRRGRVIRPLIDCRRAELRTYLDAAGVGYRHDESNEDVRIPRNRVRAELVPLLEERFNPDVVEALAVAADLAREEWRWITQAATEVFERVCHEEAGTLRLDVAGLQDLPLALARTVVWEALSRRAGARPVGFSHVDDVLELIRRPAGVLDLPGQRAQRLGPQIVLSSSSPAAGEDAAAFWYPLDVPGEVRIPAARAVLTASPAGSPGEAGVARGAEGLTAVPPSSAVVQLKRPAALAVRNWRPGDRFRPLGLGGRKKLQDFFVDRKVPRVERHRVPLVVDEFDRIVWVAGHGISEEFRVTEPSQPVLVLRLKPLGGLV